MCARKLLARGEPTRSEWASIFGVSRCRNMYQEDNSASVRGRWIRAWHGFRVIAKGVPRRRARILSFCGPAILVPGSRMDRRASAGKRADSLPGAGNRDPIEWWQDADRFRQRAVCGWKQHIHRWVERHLTAYFQVSIALSVQLHRRSFRDFTDAYLPNADPQPAAAAECVCAKGILPTRSTGMRRSWSPDHAHGIGVKARRSFGR
jgi:hypothetical protein